MRLFSRLILGYLAVFALLLAVSLYAFFQLDRFSQVSRSLLDVDGRIVGYEAKLADTLLSQVRYEKRFVLSPDDTLYDQFLLFKSDFEQYLEELTPLLSSGAAGFLNNIRGHHEIYGKLFDEEVGYLKAGQPYPRARYREEKERAVVRVLDELGRLKAYSEQASRQKIEALSERGARARRVALLLAGASLLFVVLVSVLITRSVTRPLSLLERKTREIAEGDFSAELPITSPPEMARLADAFNWMCRKLKELDQMKSDFFAAMSHELRTPLTSIKEGIALLSDEVGGPMSDKQRTLLGILSAETSRLIGLVNSLLDLAKMEAGLMAYNRGPTRLGPLIKEAMTEVAPIVEAKRISLAGEVSEDLPILQGDDQRLLQAIRNLLGNAVKFTPPGGRVTVSARRVDGAVEVRFSDTGPGIPPESLARIFDKYERAPGSQHTQGTGLGLAIVKHIVTAHGGRVWAESELGKGSSFVFVLPA